jgi:hypothetical protein
MKRPTTRKTRVTKPPKPLDQIIEESVQGKITAWPLDSAYRPEGSFEERFNKGDNQIVLWKIYGCAKNREPIPEWAAQAFCSLLIRVVKCELSWEKAFGKVPAGRRKRPPIRDLSENLLRVGQAEEEYVGPGAETKRDKLKKKLKIGRGKLIKTLSLYKRAHAS